MKSGVLCWHLTRNKESTMALSKRTFETVANMLKNERALAERQVTGSVGTVDAIALGLAAHFATENPRFDRDKFLQACGLPPRV